jgi:hypothetical protein
MGRRRQDDGIERYCTFCQAAFPLESEHWYWYVSRGGGYVRCRLRKKQHDAKYHTDYYAANRDRIRKAEKRRRLNRKRIA